MLVGDICIEVGDKYYFPGISNMTPGRRVQVAAEYTKAKYHLVQEIECRGSIWDGSVTCSSHITRGNFLFFPREI